MPVRVHIQNYQSLKDAHIEIDGFTVVTGTNNTGKSALQRAIRGVFQNTPGTSFVREGETTCNVTLDFGDTKVTWSKGTGKRDRPTYILNDGSPIHPGLAVPDEVAALGVVPIQAGGQEVWPNIAPQFSGQIFLLDRPGSALAEAVADVEKVGQLNRALRHAESDRRQAAASLRVRQEDLATYEAKVASYKGLDDVVVGLQDLEAARGFLEKIVNAIQGVGALKTRLETARRAVASLEAVRVVVVPDVSPMQEMVTTLKDLYRIRDRRVRAQREKVKYEGVQDLHAEPDAEYQPKRLLEALGVLKGFRDRLNSARKRVVDTEAAVQQAEWDLTQAQAVAATTLKEMGHCPVCGTTTA